MTERNRCLSLSISLLLIVSAICTSLAYSSSDIRDEMSVEGKRLVFEKFRSLQKDVHSIQASVSQEKQLASLKKKVLLEGTVVMAKPNMLKWDIAKPDRSVTVIDGEMMTVYHPDIKEAQVYTLSENLIARNAMGFFSIALSGTLDEMEKKFSVSMSRRDNEIILKLVPLSKMAGRYLSSIVIFYAENTGLPREFELRTPRGDKTVTKLTNIKVNPDLKPEIFKIKLPTDVWITNKPDQIGN